ncbi:hypothetical protein AAFF_G00359990 [Aldrovandia affinis]|uniref:Uncharacterized protein n=1 Tax=Aldrovandia affinis TaxID=143900 RepID=A0AAD7SIU0_9TELE|nr:hypothetical protein AAFF_G00359990 [Aldrovandia affinis]
MHGPVHQDSEQKRRPLGQMFLECTYTPTPVRAERPAPVISLCSQAARPSADATCNRAAAHRHAAFKRTRRALATVTSISGVSQTDSGALKLVLRSKDREK